MDTSGWTEDGTNLGWIHWHALRMERAWGGFVETNCQLGPLMPRPWGAGRGHAFIHLRGVRLWVKPHVVVGK
jgi:hypothetical protein